MTIRSIGILEDDEDLLHYLASTIEHSSAFEIAFLATNLSQARAEIENNPVDLCLIDIDLPDGNGLDFAAYLKKSTDTKALILTVLGDRESVISAFRSGADGYVLKDASPEQLKQHIMDVLAGNTPISPQAATHLLHNFQRTHIELSKDESDNSSQLTPREEEILNLFSKGLSYRETAEALSISHNTVSHHVKAIYSKLCVNSRSEAIYEALQLGVLDKHKL